MQVKEISAKKVCKVDPIVMEQKIKQLRKEADKMCKGMFEFVDAKGGFFEFSYRFFPGESMQTITINHGEIVDLPMGIVKHINNTYTKVRVLADQQDKSGLKTKFEKTSRIRFIPMDVLL